MAHTAGDLKISGQGRCSNWKVRQAKLTVNFLAFPSVKFRNFARPIVIFNFSGSSFFREIYMRCGKRQIIIVRVQNSYPARCDGLEHFGRFQSKEIQEITKRSLKSSESDRPMQFFEITISKLNLVILKKIFQSV